MVIINSKFYRFEPEKREQIINVAFEEFARNGDEKASTNAIIKEAKISKGSLFNYFDSKKVLYFFLFDYVTEMIRKAVNEKEISLKEYGK